jgi:hypothetical protein
MKIFDSQGKERRVLYEGDQEAGYHSEYFFTSGYGAGLYFCILRIEGTQITRKIIVLKN